VDRRSIRTFEESAQSSDRHFILLLYSLADDCVKKLRRNENKMGQNALPGNTIALPQYAGRALIGWMPANEATLWLSGRRVDLQNKEEYQQRAAQARIVVAERPAGLDQADITTACPPELNEHIGALQQNAASAQFFNEGWQISIVDLSRVCAAQPHINTSMAIQRVEGLEAQNLVSLATVSLPVSAPNAFPVAFDPSKNTWIFSSANPNLRVVGRFNGQVQPGQNAFGFIVGISASFLSVAVYQNRYLLRDGYHRAFGFLSRGINRVPAFVREFASYEELALPAGMLSQDAFLGERPPSLRDYLDEQVSAEIHVPQTQKTVLIQGFEFSTLG